MEYDVFISKNTKDLEVAKYVASILRSHDLTVFESSDSLPALGEADYAKAIDDALELSKNMVVICSENEDGRGESDSSRWVYYEWTSFRNELLSKRKTGNIVSVITSGFSIHQLPLGLRKYESFPLNDINTPRFFRYFSQGGSTYVSPQAKLNKEPSTPLLLKAYDFGYHLALNIFAKQQKKAELFDIQEDLDNFSLLPQSVLQDKTLSPEDLLSYINTIYGDLTGKMYSFGQRTGLLSIIFLFISMGAEIAESQKEVFVTTFVAEARQICLPQKTIDDFFNILAGGGSKEQIIHYQKVIRYAISNRMHTITSCPYCGNKVADDYLQCPNCLSQLKAVHP